MRLDNAPGAILLLVVIGIVAAVGAKITYQVNQTFASSEAGVVAANATESIGEFSGFMPIIGLVVAASVIIGLVVMAFAFSRR